MKFSFERYQKRLSGSDRVERFIDEDQSSFLRYFQTSCLHVVEVESSRECVFLLILCILWFLFWKYLISVERDVNAALLSFWNFE